MQQTINIAAGIRQRIEVPGAYIAVLSVTGAASFGLAILRGSEVLEDVRTMARGMSIRSSPFDTVEFYSAVAVSAEIIVGNGQVNVQTLDGSVVTVTATTPLPVSNDRGSPGFPLHVAGITYTDAPASGIADLAPVAVSASLTALHAASATRKAARYTNIGANAVAIGGAALSWARRCILLQPGDTWVEERGANVAMYAICDTALTTTVTVQEVNA